MIVKKKEKNKMFIDLTSPDGNAFVLMGTARRLAKQLGFNNIQIDAIISEMKSSDYENLIHVFDNYFGEFVVLER